MNRAPPLNVEPIVSSPLNEADEIRRQMAAIRHDLHRDVRDVVNTAERVADWGRYVGKYPWLSLGMACGAGYFLVPRRRKDSSATVSSTPIVASDSITPTATKEKAGLVGAAFGLLAPIAVRAAQGYALKYLEQWIEQQQFVLSRPPGPAETSRSEATTVGRPPSNLA